MHRASALSALVVILVANACSAPEPTETSALRDRRDDARIVEIDDFDLRAKTSAGEPLSLHAERFLHAKRQSGSGFVTYHEFSEFVLTAARLVLESPQHTSFSRLARSVRESFAAFEPRGERPRPPQRGDDDETRAEDPPIPSRVLFEPFALIEETEEGRIELHASRARLQLDSGVLVLEGAVRINGLRGERIEAKQAVLSPHEDGLFLPLGHHHHGESPTAEAVFLVAADDGHLVASLGTPRQSYDDPLSRQERVVLTHYARHAPAALQPFVYALLTQLSGPQPLAR